MQDRIGETFTGTISGVASFGIFVTLDGLDIDGLVHVTELPRDYFHFDSVRHALIGERSGRVFQLAARVNVKVVRVDLERAKIDFALDESADPARHAVSSVKGTTDAGAMRDAEARRTSKRIGRKAKAPASAFLEEEDRSRRGRSNKRRRA